MVQKDYALSFNVKDQVLDILWSICTFDTKAKADNFINWFNKVIEAKGRVVMTEICKKVKRDTIEPFERVGFNNAIEKEDLYEGTRQDGSTYYQLLFPVLKDFTIPNSKGDRKCLDSCY